MISTVVGQRIMPPWPPARGCTDYKEDRSLTDQQISLVTRWVDAGAPEGNPADYQAPIKQAGGLSRVDRTLKIPVPYRPSIWPDDYRCFVIDWPGSETTFV